MDFKFLKIKNKSFTNVFEQNSSRTPIIADIQPSCIPDFLLPLSRMLRRTGEESSQDRFSGHSFPLKLVNIQVPKLDSCGTPNEAEEIAQFYLMKVFVLSFEYHGNQKSSS